MVDRQRSHPQNAGLAQELQVSCRIMLCSTNVRECCLVQKFMRTLCPGSKGIDSTVDANLIAPALCLRSAALHQSSIQALAPKETPLLVSKTALDAKLK